MLRKYGTNEDQQVTEVEAGSPELDATIAKTAAQAWTEDDEGDLQDETRS